MRPVLTCYVFDHACLLISEKIVDATNQEFLCDRFIILALIYFALIAQQCERLKSNCNLNRLLLGHNMTFCTKHGKTTLSYLITYEVQKGDISRRK